MKAFQIAVIIMLLSTKMFAQLFINNNDNVYVQTGGSITVQGEYLNKGAGMAYNSGLIKVQADWTNNGSTDAVDNNNGTVELYGNVLQLIGGSHVTAFHNLDISTGTNLVQLNIGSSVGFNSGVLTLGARKLDLNSKVLTIKNPLPAAITRTTGFIISETPPPNYGSIAWQINGGVTSAYCFPFGNNSSGHYIPLTLNITTAGTGSGSTLTASTYPTNTAATPNNRPLPTGVTNLAGANISENAPFTVDRFWSIVPSGFSTTPVYDLTFTYRDSEWDASGGSTNLINENTLKAQGWLTKWQLPQVGTVNTAANTVTVTNANQLYNVWTLASSLSPLPIELISFDAKCDGEKGVHINWKTATEQNVSNYNIERSDDGLHFNSIAMLYPQNNFTGIKSYDWYDMNPLHTIGYYRLAERDVNGDVSIFKVVAVENCNSENEVTDIYSSGSTIYFNMSATSSNNCSIELYDATGKIVLNKTQYLQNGSNSFQIETTNIATGVYFVKCLAGNKVTTKKVHINK